MAIRVFVADDHAIVRDGVSSLLKSVGGITVVGDAADGRATVAEVQRIKPDVALIDIAMPELNGIGATEQICRTNPATKVVILSVYSSVDYICMALRAGAKGYLLKGSASNEVVDAIRAVHGGHFFLGREITNLVVREYILRRDNTGAEGPLSGLTSREREMLQMVVEGKSNGDIAEMLGLGKTSVEVYRSRLMKKLGTRDMANLFRLAIQYGLTTF